MTLPEIGEFAKGATSTSAIESDFKTRIPKESDLELGGNLTLNATAGLISVYAVNVELGGGSGLKFTGDPARRDQDPIACPAMIEIFTKLKGKASGSAGVVFDTIDLAGDGDVTLGMTIGPETVIKNNLLVPQEIALELAGSVTGSNDSKLSTEQLDLVSKHLGGKRRESPTNHVLGPLRGFKAGVGAKGSLAAQLVLREKLNVAQHPDADAAFTDFFIALQADLSPRATAKDDARLNVSAQQLHAAIDRDAEFKMTGYAVLQGGFTAEAFFGEAVASGLSYDGGVMLSYLMTAAYRNDTGTWTDSAACLRRTSP